MAVSDPPSRQRHQPWWSAAARLGQAAWFFGNLYEGLVGVPQLLAAARPERPAGLLAAGSPVRYYAPVAMLALGPTGVSLLEGWRSGADRRLITATATCVGSTLALSGYLIRTVNIPLLAGNEPLSEADRHKLIARWHRGNAVRLIALGGATAAFSRLPRSHP